MNYLEQQINKKAESRFDKDLSDLVKAISNNPIGRKLQLKIEGSEKQITFVNHYGTTGGTLFNTGYATDHGKALTNIESIKESLIEEYIKDESNAILEKLALLKEYLES